MLMRTDPFRELDRLAQQVWGTPARPAVMPMDAWREGDKFVVEFDLPGVRADSLNLDVERNTLTVRAECPVRDPNQEMVAAERPRGVFSRQLFLGTLVRPGRGADPGRRTVHPPALAAGFRHGARQHDGARGVPDDRPVLVHPARHRPVGKHE